MMMMILPTGMAHVPQMQGNGKGFHDCVRHPLRLELPDGRLAADGGRRRGGVSVQARGPRQDTYEPIEAEESPATVRRARELHVHVSSGKYFKYAD